ncbi:hypothetical protein Tco_0802244, partial [Tanacetum coccineum]
MTVTLIYAPPVNHNDNIHHQPPHTPAASPRHSTNFLNRKGGIRSQFCSDLKLELSDSNSLTVVSSRDFPHRQPIYKGAIVSTGTFGACYFIGIPLNASDVFTFVATLRLVQVPIRTIPDVIGLMIQAKVAFLRILIFLEAPELESSDVRQKVNKGGLDYKILSDSEFVMDALSMKTVLLVTHQVDFLPTFDSVLEIIAAAPYNQLMARYKAIKALGIYKRAGQQ